MPVLPIDNTPRDTDDKTAVTDPTVPLASRQPCSSDGEPTSLTQEAAREVPLPPEVPPKRRGFQPGISGNPGGRRDHPPITADALLAICETIAANYELPAETRLATIVPLVRAAIPLLAFRKSERSRRSREVDAELAVALAVKAVAKRKARP